MRVYLSSPNNQLQANAARGESVLISYAVWKKNKPLLQWAPSYRRIMVDSGAFSELNSGMKISLGEYIDWRECCLPYADSYAALDDIRGDTEKSLRNLELDTRGFPTFHDTDEWEYLPQFINIARSRPGKRLGIGIKPPREGKENWLRDVLEEVPKDVWVHGWALGLYTHLPLDSVDSTHWWREAMKVRKQLPWLTYGEALEITVKKVQRQWKLPEEGYQLSLVRRAKPYWPDAEPTPAEGAGRESDR